MYFPDRGCVRPLRTLYVYATVCAVWFLVCFVFCSFCECMRACFLVLDIHILMNKNVLFTCGGFIYVCP